MARRGSGLRTAIKVVKAIDRANKQAIRESERRLKAQEREDARAYREQQRQLNELERQEKRAERQRALDDKQAFKAALSETKIEYEDRCSQREKLKKNFIKQVLR